MPCVLDIVLEGVILLELNVQEAAQIAMRLRLEASLAGCRRERDYPIWAATCAAVAAGSSGWGRDHSPTQARHSVGTPRSRATPALYL